MQMDFDDAEEHHDPTEAEVYCCNKGKARLAAPSFPSCKPCPPVIEESHQRL
jgi:hypothetical protein